MSGATLKELRMALLVAETGNFRRAAARLDIAPSTLSHAITELEATLGLRLFHRTTRSVAPTLEGSSLLARIAPLVTQLGEVLATPCGEEGEIAGALRINTAFSPAAYLLHHVLPGFTRRHPRIEVELRHEDRLVDVVAEGSDAGIRLGHTVPGDMIGVAFGTPLRWIPVAAPSYLAMHGAPEHPHDLLDHRCIRIRMPGGERYEWEFEHAGVEIRLDVPGAITLDSMVLMVEAAVEAHGIAYVLEHVAMRHIVAGQLRPILVEWCVPDAQYMLYYSSRKNVPPPLRAFVDYLKENVLP